MATALPLNEITHSLGKAEQKLLGIWRLVDSYDERLNGEIVRSRGDVPRGILVYDGNRQMAVQVMNDGRPPFSSVEPSGCSQEDVLATLLGYTAYFGTFEAFGVNEREGYVIHHMDGNLFPNEVGKIRQRSFELEENSVILTTPPFEVDGETRVRKMVWSRILQEDPNM